MSDLWLEDFNHISEEIFIKVIRLHRRQSKFFPTVADILECYQEVIRNIPKPIALEEPRIELTPSSKDKEKDKEKDTIAHQNNFNEFWIVYPKKKSKGQAKKTWDSLLKQNKLPDVSIMLNAIAAQKAGHDWQKDNGKWIPHPSSWLSGECWEDETINRKSNMQPETFSQGLKAQIIERNKWLLEETKNDKTNAEGCSQGTCKIINQLPEPQNQ